MGYISIDDKPIGDLSLDDIAEYIDDEYCDASDKARIDEAFSSVFERGMEHGLAKAADDKYEEGFDAGQKTIIDMAVDSMEDPDTSAEEILDDLLRAYAPDAYDRIKARRGVFAGE